MVALVLYLLAVLTDGDYMNDWLTHLPAYSVGTVETAGWLLSLALGYV